MLDLSERSSILICNIINLTGFCLEKQMAGATF